MSAFENRPKLLTPFVVTIFLLDTFSYYDASQLKAVEIVGLVLLTLLTLPFYLGLYFGKNWARWTMVVLLGLTVGMMGFSLFKGDISGAQEWQKIFYSSETLLSLAFIVWSFLPKVSAFFKGNSELLSFEILKRPASLLRKVSAFVLDILVAFVIFVILERFTFYIVNAGWMKISCAVAALFFYAISNWKNYGVGQLLFKVKTVSYDGGTVPLWKHFLRPIYAFFFCFVSAGLTLADPHRRGVHDYIFKTAVVRR